MCFRAFLAEKSASRSGKGYPALQLDANLIVHSSPNPLLAAEITFCCLHGNMSQQELNLVQFSAR